MRAVRNADPCCSVVAAALPTSLCFLQHMACPSSSREWPHVELHPATARVNELIEEIERLQRMQDTLNRRQKDLDLREIAVREREIEIQAREDHLSRLHSMGKGLNKMPCDYCGLGSCSRKGPCGFNQPTRHRHHSCADCHHKWKAGVPKGAQKGAVKKTELLDFACMD